VGQARRDDEVVRLRLLHHEPHGLDHDGLGESRRKLDLATGQGAGVAHHRLGEELPEPLAIARREGIPLLDVLSLEGRRAPELAEKPGAGC